MQRLRELAEGVPIEDRWHIDIPLPPETVLALLDALRDVGAAVSEEREAYWTDAGGDCCDVVHEARSARAALARLEET